MQEWGGLESALLGVFTLVEFSAAEVSFTTIPWQKTPTSAYTFVIFMNQSSTYTITSTHHRESRLVIRDIVKNIFCHRSNFLCVSG